MFPGQYAEWAMASLSDVDLGAVEAEISRWTASSAARWLNFDGAQECPAAPGGATAPAARAAPAAPAVPTEWAAPAAPAAPTDCAAPAAPAVPTDQAAPAAPALSAAWTALAAPTAARGGAAAQAATIAPPPLTPHADDGSESVHGLAGEPLSDRDMNADDADEEHFLADEEEDNELVRR